MLHYRIARHTTRPTARTTRIHATASSVQRRGPPKGLTQPPMIVDTPAKGTPTVASVAVEYQPTLDECCAASLLNDGLCEVRTHRATV